MTRFRAVAVSKEFPDGKKPFTLEEESQRDREEAQAIIDNASADKAQANAAIKVELDAADLAIVRALTEVDTARIEAHKAAQAVRRAKLK